MQFLAALSTCGSLVVGPLVGLSGNRKTFVKKRLFLEYNSFISYLRVPVVRSIDISDSNDSRDRSDPCDDKKN